MTIYERPSQMFKQAFRGQFRVRDIGLEYHGLCSVRHTNPAAQVQGDMCWDKEDGGTQNLNLQLLIHAKLEMCRGDK